jgi:arylsulfatase A
VYWSQPGTKAEKYSVNGKELELRAGEYLPDLLHTHLVEFITRHRSQPFYIYYSLSHVHGELQRTPDSAPQPADLMADNVAYMDKLVGKLVAKLDELKLRERTLLVFMGDNGTGAKWTDKSTIGGKRLSGQKGSMLEGGALVPFIVNWPGVTPAGNVCADFADASDLVPTFAELAGATLPKDKVLDGRSFAPQLRGERGNPRDYAFMQLAREWWVRSDGWKLNQKGELFDMSGAPFEEKLVAASADTEASKAARTQLTAALAKLNPAGGILDDGDGTGRHADKPKKDKKKAEPPAAPAPAVPRLPI